MLCATLRVRKLEACMVGSGWRAESCQGQNDAITILKFPFTFQTICASSNYQLGCFGLSEQICKISYMHMPQRSALISSQTSEVSLPSHA